MVRKAFFVVPPEFHLLDLSGPAHIFYEAGAYGKQIELVYLSMTEDRDSRSSAGLTIGKLESFSEVEVGQEDWIFVPGMEAHLLKDHRFPKLFKPFLEWLGQQGTQATRICSVCTGAYILGYAGLLDGRPCTTHWKFTDDFKLRFPKAILQSDRLFVQYNQVYTSAGVSSGIDLSLYLLEEVYGPVFAAAIAKEVVLYLRRADGDPQLSVFLEYRNHIEHRIHKVQDYIAQHIGEPQLNLNRIAQEVHMSSRNLTRLFKKTTGITIGNYLEKLRVERAVKYRASGFSFTETAGSCGLSPNQLRSILRKHEAILPGELS